MTDRAPEPGYVAVLLVVWAAAAIVGAAIAVLLWPHVSGMTFWHWVGATVFVSVAFASAVLLVAVLLGVLFYTLRGRRRGSESFSDERSPE